MKPHSYTVIGDKTIFHYSFSELRQFLKEGYEHGSVGQIVTEWNGNIVKCRGFGTLENPFKWLATAEWVRHPLFDQMNPNPEHMVNPPKSDNLMSHEIILLDSSE